MSFQFFNRGGGFVYHLRALRFSKKNWATFREQATNWVANWNPQTKNLILVGPSGGYCLNAHALEKFGTIIAFDVDPLASAIFKMNHPRAEVIFRQESIFKFFADQNFEVDKISDVLFKGQKFSILFSNFLGQVEIIYPPQREVRGMPLAEWLGRLTQMLKSVSWASFHDRISTEMTLGDLKAKEFAKRPSVRELIQTYFPSEAQGEVTDHSLDSLFEGESGPYKYAVWPLVPKKQSHIIEWFQSG